MDGPVLLDRLDLLAQREEVDWVATSGIWNPK